jgi:SAM-dependent methyltransferase
VADFLQEIGLVRSLPEPAFKRAIVGRFGQRGREFLDALPREPLPDYGAVYAAGASSLELTLAVKSQFLAGFYESFLGRFAGAGLPAPRRVVDVGSGSGVTTCFYARLYPDAEVVGIDICAAAVLRARELAAKLSVDNVSFEVADALDLPEHLDRRKADIVISTLVAHEIGELHGKPARTIEDAWAGPLDRRLAGYARALAGLLEPTGVLITAERLGNVMTFARWARALHDAGVGFDRERVEPIEFVESHDDRSKLPLLLGSKSRNAEIVPNEIRMLWLQKMCPSELLCILHEMAEAVFAALCPTELLEGLHFKLSDDHSQVHHEVWEAGPLAVQYRYKNGGRDLTFVPRHRIRETVHDMDPRNNPEAAASEFFDVKKYHSPEEANDSA